MFLWTVFLYAIIVFLSFLYVKRDWRLNRKIKYIFVLSASNNLLTQQRLDRVIWLSKKLKGAKIVTCGKEKALFMKRYLRERKVTNFVVQDKSTNTYEDALYGIKFLVNGNEPIAIVTSCTHQRRAFNAFRRIFKKSEIYNYPVNPIFSLDSVLLPTGWLGIIANIYKDIKYNH